MISCLFLDDDENRHEIIRKSNHGQDVWHVRTSEEAIRALIARHYDFVSLDHDLGGGTFEASDEQSGFKVAQHIALMKSPPKRIRVHSYNPEGAANMVREMAQAALEHTLKVYYQPFNGRLF